MPRLSVLLRWLRVPLAPTAACDSAACLLLALGAGTRWAHGFDALRRNETDLPVAPDWPAPLAWIGLVGTSLLIYLFGMGLNDWADRARDRALAPTRPIPSGALHPTLALAIVLLLGAGAVALGGGPHGSRELVGAALAAAAAYDLLLKRWLVPGALSMGLVRALNAAVGLPLLHEYWFAQQMPAWAYGAPVCVGLYSAAVNVLSTTEEVDSPARRAVARGMAALAYGGAAALAMCAAGRLTLAAVIAAGTVLSLAFARVPRPGPPKRQVLEMLLGLYLLAAVLAGGSGLWQVEVGALVVAFALVYGSQRAIRALARAANA